MAAQYERIHPLLKEVCHEFEDASLGLGIVPVVTRVSDRVAGESGVHPDLRGVDYRDDTSDGSSLYTDTQVKYLIDRVNKKFPRLDGRVTAMHHSVGTSPKHIHLQVSNRAEVYPPKKEDV